MNLKKLHSKLLLVFLFCFSLISKTNAQTPSVIEPGPEHYAAKASLSKNSFTTITSNSMVETNNTAQINKTFNAGGQRIINTAQTNANCYIPPDATYTNFPGNDDGSVGPIALPFAFSLYGINYTSVFINNNGNLTFTGPSSSFDPVGFPTNIPMVAPFWADVDTRVGNTVKYKVSPTRLIVTWPGVGYFNQNVSKLNTFQVVITNGNDPLIGLGNNVAFYYGDMQWTTGDAPSNGGIGGFGGAPAVAGINKGDGINFIQIGRFNANNGTYNGPLGAPSGINYLDLGCYPLTAGSLTNLPPSVSGIPTNNTLNIACGETGTINLTALPPEVGQNVSVVIDTGGLCNTTQTSTSGTSSNATVSINGAACNEGSHDIIFIFTDNFNPSASSTITITVVVGSTPVISCPADITVSNTAGQCGTIVTYPAATATGTSPTITYSIASGSFFPVGTTTVTATATNACGTDTCTFDITVNDTQAPTISCPANITVNNTPNQCGAIVSWSADPIIDQQQASANLGTLGSTQWQSFTAGLSGQLTKIELHSNGFSSGTQPFTFTIYQGEGNGGTVLYTGSGSFNTPFANWFPLDIPSGSQPTISAGNQYTVQINITGSYSQLSINSSNPYPGGHYFSDVYNTQSNWDLRFRTYVSTNGATDNCGIPTVSYSPASGTSFAVGTTTVTGTATDTAGNTTQCTFTVTVNDTQAPTISCPANISNVIATSAAGAVVNYTAPIGTDNCPGATTVRTVGLASGATFPIGTTTVTYQVTDAAGLTALCSFTVTVIGVAPQIVCPANITVSNTPGQCGAIVTFAATETVGIPASTISYSHASGSLFPVGTTTVTATATNAVGNSTCTFTVTVNDTQAPIINCPPNIIVSNTPNQCGAIVNFNTPTVTDNCVVLVNTNQTFSYTGAMQTFVVPAGVTSVNIDAFGAQGATANIGGTGGLGARAQGTLSVTPGQTLNIFVGGQNGYNGGGTGGQNGNSVFGGPNGGLGANGGGASDVRVGGTALLNRAITAGGGGGGGSNGVWPGCQVAGPAGNGGAGGDNLGSSGTAGTGNPCNCAGGGGAGGQGGTQLTGGAAGAYAGNTACLRSNWAIGTNGTLGNGGNGSLIYFNGTGAGGGGGGGYYGGGSGGNGSDTTPGGGGGGGSSNTNGVTAASLTSNSRSGDGLVVITYLAPTSSNISLTAGLASGSTFPVGTTTQTFTATDASGNTSSCSFTVTVNDTQAPSINCPANITGVVATSPNGAVVNYIAPVGTDNCTGATTTRISGLASGATFPIGTSTVTHQVTDAAGLTAQCSFTVTVVGVAPQIVCPSNITVNNATNQCGASVNFSATETVGIPASTISYSHASGSLFPVGTTTVTATATNSVGSSSCTFTVTVNDTQAPSIICAPAVTVNNTPGLCTGTATLTAPVVTDNCTVAPQMLTNGSFGSGSDNWNHCLNNVEAYGTEGSYGGTDFSNAVAEIDHEPVTLCQSISGFVVGQTYQLSFRASRRLGAPSTVGTVITIDGGALNSTVTRSNGIFNLTSETLTFVATQTTHQLSFLPSPGWSGTVGFIIDDISITRQSVTNNAPPTFPFGNTTVTWTATDAAGNTTTCNQTVTVNDNEAPSISCPGNITVNNTANQCGANVTFAATASDNCGTANITYSPASGSFFVVGTTTVTATANDGHGNTTSCTFTVTVNDAQPPSISCPANIDVDMDPGQCGAVVTFAATASDNCGTASITYSPASGSFFNVGTTTVTATANDGHGNTASCTFTVTVDLLDWANLQWPPNATICPGGSFTAYGQVYEPNVTTVNGQQGANIEVQFGYNSTNTNPSTWSNWSPALFNQFGGGPANDEYYYNFSSNTAGTYYYTFRYRQNGCSWQYGGYSPGGGFFWDGVNNVSGVLTVQAIDWANLQWPPSATICQGSSVTAYGQVYEAGVTPGAGSQGAGIDVEFGYSTTNSNPSGWSNWTPASFNSLGGGPANDEYYYNFTPPTSGTFYYTFRYRLNNCSWQYGGYSPGGGYFWDGFNFNSGRVTVDPSTVPGNVNGGTSICPGETSALLTLSGHTGTIMYWESAVAPFTVWDYIGNSNNSSYTSGPLSATTKFRAVVQSGVCNAFPSGETTVIVYLTYPFYADNDQDGYGAGPVQYLCSDAANNPPTGYTVDGTDCDDTKADRHQTFPFYVDSDGDGYGREGSTAIQLCAIDGNTPPLPNYSVNDDDCNDGVFAIHPGVYDIPYDNIDNNCDGSLFDGHEPIVVHVLSPSCGGINHGLNNTINCTEIYLGPGYIIGYRFKVTNLVTGEVDYVDTTQHHFKLTDTDIYAYGTPYSIQVAAIVNGEVQPFNGPICTLTTTTVATTKVTTAQCGSTLALMQSTINANAVNSAITYRFRVARADAPTVYYLSPERNVPNFNLTMLTVPDGFLTYATEYRVDVQIKIKLANIIAWSQFGQVCSIFTPVPPTSSIVLSQCELVATSYTQVINATPYAGATAYRFLLTHYDGLGNIDYEQYQDSPTPSFTLSMFTGLMPNTAYNVAVAIKLYGSFVPYDKECSITTPVAAKAVVEVPFKATAYPNPYSENFFIDVKTSDASVIDIKVYDMTGRLIEQKALKANDLENASIGERYPSGVYNVIVSQGEEVRTLRVVKR